jgi:D-proline reductase (dithiol) PrdB
MIPGTLLYAWLGHLGGRSAAALLWTLAALTALATLVVALSPATTRWLAAPPRHLVNRLTARGLNALPVLGRLWARSARTAARRDVPWAELRRPLRACRAAIITTGGVHRTVDRPFDMTNPDGDPSFRVIPDTAAAAELTITHDYYDHRDADRDLNLVFPLERFRELVQEGVLGGLARSHFSFMGHVDGPLVRRLEAESIPRLLAELGTEQPDFVFLVPA